MGELMSDSVALPLDGGAGNNEHRRGDGANGQPGAAREPRHKTMKSWDHDRQDDGKHHGTDAEQGASPDLGKRAPCCEGKALSEQHQPEPERLEHIDGSEAKRGQHQDPLQLMQPDRERRLLDISTYPLEFENTQQRNTGDDDCGVEAHSDLAVDKYDECERPYDKGPFDGGKVAGE